MIEAAADWPSTPWHRVHSAYERESGQQAQRSKGGFNFTQFVNDPGYLTDNLHKNMWGCYNEDDFYVRFLAGNSCGAAAMTEDHLDVDRPRRNSNCNNRRRGRLRLTGCATRSTSGCIGPCIGAQSPRLSASTTFRNLDDNPPPASHGAIGEAPVQPITGIGVVGAQAGQHGLRAAADPPGDAARASSPPPAPPAHHQHYRHDRRHRGHLT